MTSQVIIIAAFIIVPICIMSYENIRRSNKMKEKIKDSFGCIPDENDCGKLESIKMFLGRKNINQPKAYMIDGVTWNDLDMDSVFKRINACQSSVGEENLYAILHEPIFDELKLKERNKLIEYLDQKPIIRFKIQLYLAKLGKRNFNGLSAFIYELDSKMLPNAWIYKVLALLPTSCLLIMIINFQVGVASFILSAMVNGFVYYNRKSAFDKELSAMNYIANVLYCGKSILSIKDKNFSGFTKDLRKYYSKFKYIGGKISSISSVIGQKASEFDFILDYIKLLFMYDLLSYNKVVNTIKTNKDEFYSLYNTIGEFDAAISILSYRKSISSFRWSNPEFTNNKAIEMEDIYHPLIKDPVANSAAIERNSILTGSNASGKSTFTKAIAINIIMAQTIYTCTASRFDFIPSFPITSMAVKDDVVLGESYFIAEIKSLKRILDTISDNIRCICFIDEILKGTNTIERIAASASIINYLNNKNCVVIVATHDIELTNILENSCDNYHFSENVSDEGITFDYTIRKGASKTRNAIKLLDFMGFDKTIIDNANSMAESFSNNQKW